MSDRPTFRFFEYSQNNSGGSFDIDDERGIGPRVWVEAANSDHADSRAESLGIYFNGCDEGMDCKCCGDRWRPAWGDGDESVDVDPVWDFGWHDTVYLHRMDGTIERFTRDDALRLKGAPQ